MTFMLLAIPAVL